MNFFQDLKFLPCRPPIWAQDGHTQTILGHLIPSSQLEEKGERIEIILADGDRIVGRWFRGTRPFTLTVFHGLGGTSEAGYMQRTARVAIDLGYSVLLMNHRGSGEGSGLARGLPHSGRGEDISAGIAWAKQRNPGDTQFALGFSMSANALLLLLSGQRGETFPDLAMAVNAPIDLGDAALRLETGLNRVYDFRFVNECRRDMNRRRAQGVLERDLPISPLATLRDFDELYTAPLNGFRDRTDYYSQCSTKDLLGNIKTPTLILTASDDPFVNVKAYQDAKPSPFVHLHIEPKGGHMGYLTRTPTPLGSKRWLDYAIFETLSYAMNSYRR